MKKYFIDLMVVVGTWVACMWLLFYLSNLNQVLGKNVDNSIDNESELGYDEKELKTKYYITTGSQGYREVKGEEIESVVLEELMLEVEEAENKKKVEEIKRLDQLAKEKELARLEEVKRKEEAKRKQEELKAKEKASKKDTYDSDWETFNASYYTAYCTSCSGITATGIDVRKTITYKGYRIVAADPKVLPMGTIVEIETPHETFKAYVGDKGGAIKGHKLDILVKTKSQAYDLGRHDVKLRVIEYPKK